MTLCEGDSGDLETALAEVRGDLAVLSRDRGHGATGPNRYGALFDTPMRADAEAARRLAGQCG